MITKYCALPATTAGGEPGTRVIPVGNMEKIAFPLLPKVADFVNTLRPHEDKIFLLINALGASEFYGGNHNGDIFPEEALKHKGFDYGHLTFLRGHVFCHHRNQDPNKAIGNILLAAWHDIMKRVELVVEISRQMAMTNGGDLTLSRLDAGEPIPTSMGTRVPFDLCTICTDFDKYEAAKATFDPRVHRRVADAILEFHRRDPIPGLSPTAATYCEHIRLYKGKILDDGRYVGMVNTYPSFFDISSVFIPADRTSSSLVRFLPTPQEKVIVDVEKVASWSSNDFMKVALWGGDRVAQPAEIEKDGEIVKRVASNFDSKILPAVELLEEDIPRERLAQALPDIQKILSTLLGLGVLLKPREFDGLMTAGFPASRLSLQAGAPLVSKNSFCPRMAEAFADLMPNRSFHAPFLIRRAIRIRITKMAPRDKESISPQLLDKVGSVFYTDQGVPEDDLAGTVPTERIGTPYGTYRQQAAVNAAGLARAASEIPGLRLPADVARPGALPMIYVMKAHQEEAVKEESGLLSFIKEHPWLTASVVIPGVIQLRRWAKR